ncbi:hypothetical protein H6G35_02020 [Aulosira sp. FACHB-113]|nr:hypothetical protein [Aulosira sp. FACHB-113]
MTAKILEGEFRSQESEARILQFNSVQLVDKLWFKAPDFKALKDSITLRCRGDKEKFFLFETPDFKHGVF